MGLSDLSSWNGELKSIGLVLVAIKAYVLEPEELVKLVFFIPGIGEMCLLLC